MNRSPLHDLNKGLGARFVGFGGWEMPVQYRSVIAEHKAVRNSSGVFDVTHLGRFEIAGAGAKPALRSLLCNDIERVEPGRCQYTMVLNPKGGIVDDMIVWWVGEDRFWVLPNATNHETVMSLFGSQPVCGVRDLQRSTVMLAVQGPEAPDVLREVLGTAPRRFRNERVEWKGREVYAAGTGYTGDPGGEISTDNETGAELFRALVECGATPAGLGARDTLRLEAGLPLWGKDLDESTTPLEAGLNAAVSMGHDFVGKSALAAQIDEGLSRRLACFVMRERGIPRNGQITRHPSGASGVVTSGNMSPVLNTGIGMAYIRPPVGPGANIEVEIRDRWLQASVVRPPFYIS